MDHAGDAQPIRGTERAGAQGMRAEVERAMEAVLMVADEPVAVGVLAELLEQPAEAVDRVARRLAAEYEAEGRGYRLHFVAGGWRFESHPDLAGYVERFAREGMPTRLSGAALETLAVVAYRQPISRGQLGAIRGVSVDGTVRMLVRRGYLAAVGRDDGPGQAVLFGTTAQFLDHLGIGGLDELPALSGFVPDGGAVEALEERLRGDG